MVMCLLNDIIYSDVTIINNMMDSSLEIHRFFITDGPIVGLNLHGAVKIVENTKLTLKCQVNANPPVATVTWFKGGQRQTGL